MARITIDNIATYSQTPTITGTVEFEHFDAFGEPSETFQIVINYATYRLFEGNLGLNERVLFVSISVLERD